MDSKKLMIVFSIIVTLVLGYLVYSNYQLKKQIKSTTQVAIGASSNASHAQSTADDVYDKADDLQSDLDDANSKIDDLESDRY